MRNQRTIMILLVAVLLLTPIMPSMRSYAQDDPPSDSCEGSGVFYWPCRVVEAILSGIQNFFNWIVNSITDFFGFLGGVFEWVVTAVRNVITAIGDIFRLIFEFIGEIFRLVGELIQIVGLIIQIMVALVKLLGAWIFQAVAIVAGFIYTFFSTDPEPFPGAPLCITAPTDHDLCAFWYLFDNTVWGGSVGSVIVLVIVLLIDLPIVFYFVRRVQSYLHMGEEITNV